MGKYCSLCDVHFTPSGDNYMNLDYRKKFVIENNLRYGRKETRAVARKEAELPECTCRKCMNLRKMKSELESHKAYSGKVINGL